MPTTIELILAAQDRASAPLGKVGKGMQIVGKLGAGLALGFGAVATAGAVAVSQYVQQATALKRLSQATGIQVDELSSLEYAYRRNGLELDDLRDTFAELADRKGVTGLKGLFDFADELAGLDVVARTRKAMETLGDDVGLKLLPVLSKGSKALKDLAKEADDLGVSLDNNAADAAVKLGKQMDRLKGSVEGAKNRIVGAIMPALLGLAKVVLPIVTTALVGVGSLISSIFGTGADDVNAFNAELRGIGGGKPADPADPDDPVEPGYTFDMPDPFIQPWTDKQRQSARMAEAAQQDNQPFAGMYSGLGTVIGQEIIKSMAPPLSPHVPPPMRELPNPDLEAGIRAAYEEKLAAVRDSRDFQAFQPAYEGIYGGVPWNTLAEAVIRYGGSIDELVDLLSQEQPMISRFYKRRHVELVNQDTVSFWHKMGMELPDPYSRPSDTQDNAIKDNLAEASEIMKALASAASGGGGRTLGSDIIEASKSDPLRVFIAGYGGLKEDKREHERAITLDFDGSDPLINQDALLALMQGWFRDLYLQTT